MPFIRSKPCRLKPLLIVSGLALPVVGNAATTVTMHTSLGDIGIQLFDDTAPQTVANFLSYVNSGAYNNSFIHRSVPGFVIQGGGYTWNTVNNTYSTIPTHAPVVNEFGASNLRGTIAMAKLGNDPNSATDQWFFNLANNSGSPAYLDTQNGGFTVFGQVIGNGMAVVDAIAALPTVNACGGTSCAFTNLPLATPLTGGFTAQNFVMLTSVQVTSSNAVATPIPAAAWLFGSGLLGLAGLAKRRKA